ncbi:MAG: TetR/AcrR family transcriptional regulator [Armatimonadota bacterium]
MNKKDLIISEAKQLFGRNGYLGFTLKQLADACDMTSPALYYFYSSKAELFKDCLLSEMESRKVMLEEVGAKSNTLAEFAAQLAPGAIDICDVHHFRTGRAMDEIIHLPAALQEELKAAWESKLIAPILVFIERILPIHASKIAPRLVATYLFYMATFSAAHGTEFDRDQLSRLFVASVNGLQEEILRPAEAQA